SLFWCIGDPLVLGGGGGGGSASVLLLTRQFRESSLGNSQRDMETTSPLLIDEMRNHNQSVLDIEQEK
ncbi:hypothetical protein ACJX0J_031897, partial [Zea mays]